MEDKLPSYSEAQDNSYEESKGAHTVLDPLLLKFRKHQCPWHKVKQVGCDASAYKIFQ